jgi:hypothetical protein
MRPHVVVSSVIANKPFNGGNARMVLNWLEGFRRLGAEVFFVEQIRSETCLDATGAATAASESENRGYFDRVLAASGFGDCAVLICDAKDTLDEATIHGATAGELRDLATDADLLVNISGHLDIAELKTRFRCRAYVDLDPGYTQLWNAQGSNAARLDDHDLYFTVGQRIGTPSCTVPTAGIPWQPIRQPIVLAGCAAGTPPGTDRFTTVASWRGAYAPITHDGDTFGNKAHEFRKIVNLPRLSARSFEVALDIHPADCRDLNALSDSGWQLVDPRVAVSTPEAYCRYIEGSTAECTAAQGMYVKTRCGWFSDRSARYLASGKPVLVQDTGFQAPGRPGEGLVVFDTVEQAARGAEQIARHYSRHSEAARWIAERYFDSDRQLGRVMEQAGLA